MNREDIIRMAREAGVRAAKLLHEFGTEGALCDSEIQDLRAAERLAQAAYVAGAAAERNSWPAEMEAMERQVNILTDALAQAKAEEREACAKVADSISEDQWALYKGRPPYTGKELERASDYTQGKSDGAEVCAAAIRARGRS